MEVFLALPSRRRPREWSRICWKDKVALLAHLEEKEEEVWEREVWGSLRLLSSQSTFKEMDDEYEYP